MVVPRQILTIKKVMIRAFLFDESKQQLYLTILSAQLRMGRTYKDIFGSLLRSNNSYFRKLARRSLDPNTPYFASRYDDLFGKRTSRLLTLSQRFNVVPRFIDESIVAENGVSGVLRSVVLPNSMEIGLTLTFFCLCVGLYLYNDALLTIYGDFSNNILYFQGAFIFENRYFLLFAGLLGWCLYWWLRNTSSVLRRRAQCVGLYYFHDAIYAIDLFTMIKILTSSTTVQRGNVNTLIREISAVFGKKNSLRRQQFAVMRLKLSSGSLFREAIESSGILTDEILDLFKGLSPNESMDEICKASEAVEFLLRKKVSLEMSYLRKSLQFFLLAYLAVAMVAVVDITMGGGTTILQQSF